MSICIIIKESNPEIYCSTVLLTYDSDFASIYVKIRAFSGIGVPFAWALGRAWWPVGVSAVHRRSWALRRLEAILRPSGAVAWEKGANVPVAWP